MKYLGYSRKQIFGIFTAAGVSIYLLTLENSRSHFQRFISKVMPLFGNTSSEVVMTYHLRKDQNFGQIHSKLSPTTIYSPSWVDKLADNLLKEHATHITSIKLTQSPQKPSFLGFSSNSETERTVPMPTNVLSRLQILSRNEMYNVNGNIPFSLYAPALKDEPVILSLKDLVRQTVIVSSAKTTHYGGYRVKREKQGSTVIICDLAGLQFQQQYNSGRLVLLSEHPLPEGILDAQIYENVVGRMPPSFDEARNSNDPRFIPTPSHVFGGRVIFDAFAYTQFVANDFLLAGLAINDFATQNNIHGVSFKFLKYGSGFFGGDFVPLIETFILRGVLQGIEMLFENLKGHQIVIKEIDLPFFENTEVTKVAELEEKYKIKIHFSKDDALKCTNKLYVTATTNCGDPHAVFGNEMQFSSVDAAIAENIEEKGNQFCPLLNRNMGTKVLFFNNKLEEVGESRAKI